MQIQVQHTLNPVMTRAILDMWNREYPVAIKQADLAAFQVYLDKLGPSKHFLLTDETQLGGWAVEFDRIKDRWFIIIIDQAFQGKGFGRQLLNQLKAGNDTLNGWIVPNNQYLKSNGLPYLSPLEFYKKQNFELKDETVERGELIFQKIEWHKAI